MACRAPTAPASRAFRPRCRSPMEAASGSAIPTKLCVLDAVTPAKRHRAQQFTGGKNIGVPDICRPAKVRVDYTEGGRRIPQHQGLGHNANLAMRILMLGGTNLTGPYAVRRLHALGHEVSVFHRGEHEADLPSGVRHIHGDFQRLPREAFDPAPEVVVHMWAM